MKLIHINNTGPDLLPLKTSKITLDWTYRALNETEKLAIWEDGVCLDSLKRPMDINDTVEVPPTKRPRKPQYTDTVHHYCEEFWFKTNVDIMLNMTAVIPVIDDLIENYFPSLPGDSQTVPPHIPGHAQIMPAHVKGRVGLKQRPQSEGAFSLEKQPTHSHQVTRQTKLTDGANQRKVS